MYKLKEWLSLYLLVGAYIWGLCGVFACIVVPPTLACCCSPWWFLSWIVTIPAAVTIIIAIGRIETEDEQE